MLYASFIFLKMVLSLILRLQVHEVKMDRNSNYLAISGSDLRLYSIAPKKPEDWAEVKVFGDHTADVTAARFGPDDSFLVSAGMDKSVKYYAAV